ncbi:MAG: hypothetical protein QW393_03555, partial [Candidatus Micrarchaeaceae archaeon]
EVEEKTERNTILNPKIREKTERHSEIAHFDLINDFYMEGGEFGIDLLNNAYSVVVFTNKDVPKKFIESHRLTDDEVRFIRSDTGIQHPAGGKPYSQCLLIQKDRRFRLVVEGLELESELATTKPEDLRERGERSA